MSCILLNVQLLYSRENTLALSKNFWNSGDWQIQVMFIFRQCSLACLTLLQHLEKSSFDRSGQLLHSQTREITPFSSSVTSVPASTGSGRFLEMKRWDPRWNESICKTLWMTNAHIYFTNMGLVKYADQIKDWTWPCQIIWNKKSNCIAAFSVPLWEIWKFFRSHIWEPNYFLVPYLRSKFFSGPNIWNPISFLVPCFEIHNSFPGPLFWDTLFFSSPLFWDTHYL